MEGCASDPCGCGCDAVVQVLAVGDAAGVLHLFELPRTLRRPLQNEKRLMEAFVGREAARLADVASRQVHVVGVRLVLWCGVVWCVWSVFVGSCGTFIAL